ncbi:MAG: GIY-YIG nuclease family protein [Bacillota bacterium]
MEKKDVVNVMNDCEKRLAYDSGVYLLEMYLKQEQSLKIGARGNFTFFPGYYFYCGTAQQYLRARLERHLRQKKKFHWHIDYFLQVTEIETIYCWPDESSRECELASDLLAVPESKVPVEGFGASDCGCRTHLLYFTERPEYIVGIENRGADIYWLNES